MMNPMFGTPNLPANRRQSKAIEAHRREVDLQATQSITLLQGQQTVVEYELDINAMVLSRAAANEMSVAEHMVARAGVSKVAQTIAADRIDRLMQADNRTLSKAGL